MASVNSKEIPEEFNMFGELFTLYKKYYHAEDSEVWWVEVVNEFRSLHKKYDTELCSELSVACIREIERKYLENKK